ncbi:MAG: hypothetical protein RIB52_12085 [Erythrobacter sp.]|uniref:hypothetical protein n=1 Tax=Erythrobacter sp. TaxID=1042 RepID=UPI0032EF7B02
MSVGEPDEREHWLRVFAVMFSCSAFEREAADAFSFHDRARREAAFYEERVAKNLSDLVFEKLYPKLGKAIAEQAPADAELDEIRNATLILLYRLLFILYAEDRGLRPVKDARYDDYAMRVARKDVGERMDKGDTFSSVAANIWARFADLSAMIDKGDPSVGRWKRSQSCAAGRSLAKSTSPTCCWERGWSMMPSGSRLRPAPMRCARSPGRGSMPTSCGWRIDRAERVPTGSALMAR